MVTIEEVANYAGVSVATVSRVLNNSSMVKPATIQRVQEAIQKLNYIPNQSARNLRRQESRVILALAPNFSNPYYSRILTGIGDRSHDRGYSLLICNTAGKEENEKHFLEMLKNHRADGAILLGCQKDAGWLEEYARLFPIVQCCEYVPYLHCPSVSIDNYSASLEMVRYLCRLGHRHIAMLGADNRFISTRLRREGYLAAMEESVRNLPDGYYEDYYSEADAEYTFASGQLAARKLLTLTPRPTAVFCVSDILALSVISVAKEQGLSVPEDLTVTGFDDVDYTTMFHPYLTTIAQPCYEMGQQSIELLLRIMQDRNEENAIRTYVPYNLVERESSALIE